MLAKPSINQGLSSDQLIGLELQDAHTSRKSKNQSLFGLDSMNFLVVYSLDASAGGKSLLKWLFSPPQDYLL